LADEGGFEELRRLGARSVPVVSRGDRFVFAQVIRDVVEFLGLDEKTVPVLSPAELHARYDHVLETAIRLVRQMPDDRLETQLPNRPRSWRMVMHHIFQIPTGYLDMEENGEDDLPQESIPQAPLVEVVASFPVVAAPAMDIKPDTVSAMATWWAQRARHDHAAPRKAALFTRQYRRHREVVGSEMGCPPSVCLGGAEKSATPPLLPNPKKWADGGS
jgi:hypothetical protein